MKSAISIEGGYLVPESDKVASVRCVETQRLDFDFAVLEKLKPFIPEGGFVVDVGACIGAHSLFYSNLVKEKGLVIAMEPGDQNLEFLQYNSFKFPFQNVFTTNHAAAHRFAPGKFIYNPDNVGESTCEMLRNREDHNVDFHFECIDKVVENVTGRKVDFIKIDVEGWELYALVGAMLTIKRDKPVLLVEINPKAMFQMKIMFDTLVGYLVGMGYSMKRLQETEIPEGGVYDFICMPE